MDGSLVRQPEIADRGHPGGALPGVLDAQPVLLTLGDVAELLGEPESVIVAACRSFPEHVPVVGSGRERRFPSIALDVLRLITDATAAAVPATAIVHLIETHYSAMRDLVDEIQTSPHGVPTGYEHHVPPFDLDEVVGRVQEAVEISILPIVQMLATELGIMRATIDQTRVELRRGAQSDTLELARAETEHLAGAQTSPPQLDAIATELAAIQARLRPALHGLDDIRLAVDGLREEMTALRWQLDQREQMGRLVAELGELRAQVARIEPASPRPDDGAREAGNSHGSAADGADVVDDAGELDDVAANDAGDDIEQVTESSQPSDPEPPSAIITEFASRTPRRMGRTPFADEG